MNKIEYLGGEPTLFLDISSSCTGFVVASFNVATKEAKIIKSGVIWFDKSWDHGRKYKELQDFVLNIAYVQYRVQNIVAEGYMVNPKRVMGTLVIPEATGAIKAACYEAMPPMGFYLILPQSWRSALKIKKDSNLAGSKQWKEPTQKKIEKFLGIKFPDKIPSNINGKMRQMPYDLVDAFGVCLGWLLKDPNNCKTFLIEEGAIPCG